MTKLESNIKEEALTNKRGKLANAKKKIFLGRLRETCNVAEACRTAGFSRSAAYEFKELYPDFKDAWDECIENAIDDLEREARRRGYEGYEEPVVFQGQFTWVEGDNGEKKPLAIRKYSDRLLEILLKAHRPTKYVEKHVLSGPNGGPIPIKAIEFKILESKGNGD